MVVPMQLGLPHPDPVVEKASLAAVPPPDVRHQLALDPAGLLSDLQLETVVMACQRHHQVRAPHIMHTPPSSATGQYMHHGWLAGWLAGHSYL